MDLIFVEKESIFRKNEPIIWYQKVVIAMKKHKLFAWLTVAFFLLTILTGYEKK